MDDDWIDRFMRRLYDTDQHWKDLRTVAVVVTVLTIVALSWATLN